MSGPTGPRREQSKNHANAKNETAPLPETGQKPSGAMALHGNSRHFLVQTMLQRTKAGTENRNQRLASAPPLPTLAQQARKPVPTMPPSGRRPFISRNGFPSDSPWLSERSARRARSEFHGAKAAPARFLCILSCACKKGCRPPGRVPASRNEKNSYHHTKTNNFSNKTT